MRINRILLIFVFSLWVIPGAFSQEQLKHEKKIFRSEDNKLYVNKDLPLFVRIATSPDEDAETWLLYSEISKQYTNPMYFDTEGWNSIRTPSAVDTTTKKIVYPLQDIIFEVYADGIAPVSTLKFSNSKKFTGGKMSHYGGELEIELTATDAVSGIENIYFSINKAPYKPYSQKLTFEDEKEYEVSYYAVDNVGNVEKARSVEFTVDLSPPVTKHVISGLKDNNIVAPDATISLVSQDNFSGVKNIYYSINEGSFKVYSRPLPVSLLGDGNSKLEYYAVDNVGNEESTKSIGAYASGNPTYHIDEVEVVFDFYIDREPPVVSFHIDGDQFAGNGNFVSERSKIRIEATDDKSGVKEIKYSYNNFITSIEYDAPFKIEQTGNHTLSFTATDYVGNTANHESVKIILDNVAPKSSVNFEGPKFSNRDTLFICSETKIKIGATDSGSGLKDIFFQLNGNEKQKYEMPIQVSENGYHEIRYSAVDNVNNIETENIKGFYIDNIPPVIHHHFSVEPIGEKTVRDENYTIFPSNSKLYIAATDNLSGGEKVEYRVNGRSIQSKIPIENFTPGNYEIEITAADVLNNIATRTIKFAIEK